MSVGKLRRWLRVVHLVCAGALGFLVYAPTHVTEGTFRLLVAIVVFPLIALTGYGMWFGPALVRRRRRTATKAES